MPPPEAVTVLRRRPPVSAGWRRISTGSDDLRILGRGIVDTSGDVNARGLEIGPRPRPRARLAGPTRECEMMTSGRRDAERWEVHMLGRLLASGQRLERTAEEWEQRGATSVRRATRNTESLPVWEALSHREQDLVSGCFWAIAMRLSVGPDDRISMTELAAGADAIDAIWPATSSWVIKGAFTPLATDETRIQDVVMGPRSLSRFASEARAVIERLPESDRRRVGGALVQLAKVMIAADGQLPRDVKAAKAMGLLQALGVDADADLAWVREHGA